MEYVPPFGRESEGEAAHYINGNPVEGQQGSIPDAMSWEAPLRELTFLIRKNKLTPDGDDLTQVLKGVRSQAANFVDDTGSANNLSVALDPPLAAYTVGLPIRVRVHTTNTGGATIDAGAGRVPIKKMSGGGTAPGDLPAGGIAEMVYDGTAFQLVNFGGAAGGAGDQFLIKIPYTVDTSPTPNIVTAVFSPAITALVAGDPLLVKIANTCTGSSVIRVNGLPDKPIRANGGGSAPTLQGDLTAGDVVLFLYDGSSFWIQPNPLISANTTLGVPSQYATPEDALLAIRRKMIAQNATVTVQIAQGIFPPFKINHANADRVVIKGTMKIPGNLTGPMFSQTGNGSAQRAADSANNIAMLRTRYGTEIQVPASSTLLGAIENSGPGNPIVQDMLLTGPNYWSGDGVGRWVGVNHGGGRNITCNNISAWGLDMGFYGSGVMFCNNCFGCGLFRTGFFGTAGALYTLNACGSLGNGLNGVSTSQNSFMGVTGSWCNFNANAGANSGDASELTVIGSQIGGNAYIDVFAGVLSMTWSLGSTVGTYSPSPGFITTQGALIMLG